MRAGSPSSAGYQPRARAQDATPCGRGGGGGFAPGWFMALALVLGAAGLPGCAGDDGRTAGRPATEIQPATREPVRLLRRPEQATQAVAASVEDGAAMVDEPALSAEPLATAEPPASSGSVESVAVETPAATPTTPPADDDPPAPEAAPVASTSPVAVDPVPAPSGEPPPGRTPLVHARLRELDGRPRVQEPLTFGMPLARGVAADTSALRLWDAHTGEAMPCQTRALSRWPDGSVRWVLVDTRADMPPSGERRLALGPAEDLAPDDDPWQLSARDDGTLLASDGTTTWTIWQPAADGDRVLDLRAVLNGRFGHDYVARVDDDRVEILERGPLRLVFAVRGSHRPLEDDPELPDPFHTFTARLHLLAGQGVSRVEWSLENGPLLEPPGRLGFRSYTLHTPAPRDMQAIDLPVRRNNEVAAVRVEHLGGGRQIVLDEERLPSGNRNHDGWFGLRGADDDLWLLREDATGNHPNGLRWRPGFPVALELLRSLSMALPGVGPSVSQLHALDDATRKTFRFSVGRGLGVRGSAVMNSIAQPVHVALSPLEVFLSRAWGDAGLIYPTSPAEAQGAGGLPRNAYTGWADYGEVLTKNTHSSGSPRNRLSVFLEAVQSGSPDAFRWARTRARHAMDLRPFHIQGFDADEYPAANLYEGVPHPNIKASLALGRREMGTRWPEWGQDVAGHGYNGFDPEHMTLDDIYECYLLTGSWPAREALRSAGEAMLTWQELVPGGWIHSARTFGWTLRALVQVHRATGEERYLDAARRYVARADEERGHGDVKYLRRMKPDPRHMDEFHDTPFMVAVALHGLAAYWHETEDPRVPPMCADLTDFLMSGYRGRGFLDDLPTDRAPDPGGSVRELGVSSWIPGAIAAAAFVTGDHTPVDRIGGYYQLMRTHRDRPIAFGAKDWHWWQPYLVSIWQRHGSLAEPPHPSGR